MTKHYLKELPDDAKQVKNALNWVDRAGNVYGLETRKVPNRYDKELLTPVKHYGEYFKLPTYTNRKNGYVYGNFKHYTDKPGVYEKKTRRVHIVVAETFLENPNHLPIVGHRNSIKTDNRVDNLYWTTPNLVLINTVKQLSDIAEKFKAGKNEEQQWDSHVSDDDSQSKPVFMFDTKTNKLLGAYGSICEAVKETGRPKTTISRQCRYKRPVRTDVYFRFQDDDSVK